MSRDNILQPDEEKSGDVCNWDKEDNVKYPILRCELALITIFFCPLACMVALQLTIHYIRLVPW